MISSYRRSRIVYHLKSLRKKLVSYLYNKACDWGIHTHSDSKWEQSNSPAVSRTYFGRCRICGVVITPEYHFSKLEGPIFEGVPIYGKDYRDLEAIVTNCVKLFIKNEFHK